MTKKLPVVVKTVVVEETLGVVSVAMTVVSVVNDGVVVIVVVLGCVDIELTLGVVTALIPVVCVDDVVGAFVVIAVVVSVKND